MKIVHVAASYAPNRGGVETHLHEVATIQSQQGHQVIVICQQQASEKLSETIGSVQVLRIPQQYKNKKLSTWKWMFSNLQLLTQADVVHVHDIFWMLVPFQPFVALHAKIITTFHGWEGAYPIAFSAKALRLLYSFLSYKTVHVGGYIQEFYWDIPNAVVYGGSPSTTVGAIKTNKKTISFLGRLVSENCIHEYLALFSALKQNDQGITIQWIGDGPFRDECKEVGEVTGMVDNPLSIVKAAEVICANSYLSIIEALSAGKTVCALYDNPLKQRYLETFPQSKQLLIASNPQMLIQPILKVVSGKSTSTKQKTDPQFTWQHLTNVYNQLYGV